MDKAVAMAGQSFGAVLQRRLLRRRATAAATARLPATPVPLQLAQVDFCHQTRVLKKVDFFCKSIFVTKLEF
jgi:hypothetical protein